MKTLQWVVLAAVALTTTWTVRAQERPNESVALLQKRAESGDAKAQDDLALRYQMGDGVEKDVVKAVEWYRRAAKQGDAVAYYNLGAAYYNGEGVVSNENAACKWFFLAAEAGDESGKNAFAREKEDKDTLQGTNCEVLAGDAYRKGDEIPKDEKRALTIYEDAAQKGNGVADLRLFSIYAEGVLVPKDASAAMKWLNEGAARGDVRAFYARGRIYESGEGLANPDLHLACENYKEAVWRGLPDALTPLGKLLHEGRGVKRNPEEAYYYLRIAEMKNDPKAAPVLDAVKAELSKKQIEKVEERFHLANPKVHDPCN